LNGLALSWTFLTCSCRCDLWKAENEHISHWRNFFSDLWLARKCFKRFPFETKDSSQMGHWNPFFASSFFASVLAEIPNDSTLLVARKPLPLLSSARTIFFLSTVSLWRLAFSSLSFNFLLKAKAVLECSSLMLPSISLLRLPSSSVSFFASVLVEITTDSTLPLCSPASICAIFVLLTSMSTWNMRWSMYWINVSTGIFLMSGPTWLQSAKPVRRCGFLSTKHLRQSQFASQLHDVSFEHKMQEYSNSIFICLRLLFEMVANSHVMDWTCSNIFVLAFHRLEVVRLFCDAFLRRARRCCCRLWLRKTALSCVKQLKLAFSRKLNFREN